MSAPALTPEVAKLANAAVAYCAFADWFERHDRTDRLGSIEKFNAVEQALRIAGRAASTAAERRELVDGILETPTLNIVGDDQCNE